MDKHITILAVLYIAFSVLGLLAGFIVFVAVAGGGLMSGDTEAMMITAGVGIFVAMLIFVLSVPGLIGGIGLLKKKPWARILVLIVGFLNLVNIPIGTILGVYTIWVLLKNETAQLFASA